jgi:competence protein ComEC
MQAWLTAERGRFTLWLPVGLFAGVLLYFALHTEPPLWLSPVVLLCVAILGWLLRGRAVVCAICLMCAAIAGGFTSGAVATWRAAPMVVLPSKAVIVRGTVSLVEPLPDGRRITIAHPSWPGQDPVARDVRVRLRKGDDGVIAAGDEVQVRALLRASPMPAWPGAWDLQRYAYFADRAGGGMALGAVEVLQTGENGRVALWWQGVRQRLAERVMADLPGPSGAVAATLFTGLGGAISPDDRGAFRDAGLAHLLAVAGLHIGAVMGTVFAAARLLLASCEYAALRWPCKQIAGVAALLAGLLYLLLTGAHVPIERSFAMATLVTLGLLTGRRALSLRGLGLAAVAILLISPAEAVDVSFQMSFSAVMALIGGYEVMRPWLARLRGDGFWRRAGAHLAALTLTSVLAGGAAMPIAAYHFGQIQLWFVPANLVAVPLTAFVALPAGIVSLALMPFGLEQIALRPMGWTLDAVLWIAHFVSSWPAATLRVPQMPNWGALCVGGGLCWLCLWRSRVRWAGLAPVAAGLVSIAVVTPPDLMVSSDARLIGVRTSAGVFVQSVSGARFVRDSWAEAWGVRQVGGLADAPARLVDCAAEDCLLQTRPDGPVVLLSLRGAMSAECDQAVLVVSAQPARSVCRGLPMIDRFTVWRDGAHAVWLRGSDVVVLSDRAVRGDRPWVPPVPHPHGQQPDLPLALRDE